VEYGLNCESFDVPYVEFSLTFNVTIDTNSRELRPSLLLAAFAKKYNASYSIFLMYHYEKTRKRFSSSGDTNMDLKKAHLSPHKILA